MRIQIACLTALSLISTGLVHADISDNGNLTLSNQAVVQGTMTVQGSAFSVGGSTFSVAAGSVTLGGPLNAAPSGIKWADGSTSTTAVTVSPGTAILSATQTFSGSNTFASSMTIGSGGNLTVLGTSNLWVMVSSLDITAVSTVTFSGLVSSVTYRVEYDVFTSSAIFFAALFNDDSNQNYGTSIFTFNQGGTVAGGSSSAYGSGLTRTDVTTLAKSSIIGTITFASDYGGGANNVAARSESRYTNSTVSFKNPEGYLASHSYAGTSPLNAINFVTSSVSVNSGRTDRKGPITGHFELWRKGFSHP